MADQIQAVQTRLTLNDATATPIAGGSITFYRSGTTTLATIYANELGTLPLANPVVADASGRIAQVFFTGDYDVKAVIRNAEGALVDVIDPCPRWSSSTSAASGISYAPSENNTATDVQAAIDANAAEIVTQKNSVRAISKGGTGASTASGARTSLGLGDAATKLAVANADMTVNPNDVPTRAAVDTFVGNEITGTLNISGAAPAYVARAAVVFKGSDGTIFGTARNVSSVVRQSIGKYRVNFSTDMPALWYSIGGMAQRNVASGTAHNLCVGLAQNGGTRSQEVDHCIVEFRATSGELEDPLHASLIFFP